MDEITDKPKFSSYVDKFNVMIVGDDSVGKTSIIEQYIRGVYQPDQKANRGIEHFTKEFTLDNKTFLFKLWDTVNDSKFRKIAKSFYAKADCVIIVCATNNRDSFLNIRKWEKNISENGDMSTLQLILLSNKCDLEDERQIGMDEIRQKAEELNIEYFETSACTNYGIEDAFTAIFTKVINTIYKGDTEPPHKEIIKDSNESNSFGDCCII